MIIPEKIHTRRKFLPSRRVGEKNLFLIIVSVLGHPKGVGGLTSNFLCGKGIDVFWNEPLVESLIKENFKQFFSFAKWKQMHGRGKVSVTAEIDWWHYYQNYSQTGCSLASNIAILRCNVAILMCKLLGAVQTLL